MKFLSTLFLLMALAVCSTASAGWEIPGTKFDVAKMSVKAGIPQPLASENDLVLMPTASLGFEVGPANPAYGYSGAWDLVFAKVSPGESGGTVSMSPYLGIGGALFFDAGPSIASGFQTPLLVDAGFNIIGPEIGGIVPGAQMVWNLQSGEKKTIVNANLPFDVFPAETIFKLFGL